MFRSATRGLAVLAMGLAVLAAPLAAFAADAAPTPNPLPPGIILTTQDAAVGAAPGKAITFPVSVTNNTNKLERIKLGVASAPKDWAPVFQDRGYDVTEVELLPGKDNTVTFQVTPPSNAQPGSQRISLEGNTDDGLSTKLDLGVTINGSAGGSNLKLTTDYPVLRGASGTKFEFKATIANNTGKDNTFGLSATAPGNDWLVYFQPAFDQKQISSIAVKSGSTQDVNVEVQSPQSAKPNDFPVNVKVSDDAGNTASVDLKVTIIGNYKLDFNPQQQLNTNATAGQAKTMQIVLANTGTAPVQNISLSATGLPSNWTMTFSPDKVDSIDPGTQRQVQATLTPAAKAIAGDYSISLSASSTNASVNKDFRVTVETPTIWGWVGLGIVVIVVGGLVWMFASYSRR
ncbi:MAG TPA: NEW3 domain-containing protein [Chloroflexota bacterium]|nr:NEW3 domain-containing protein [Chloroflexota bacterium]